MPPFRARSSAFACSLPRSRPFARSRADLSSCHQPSSHQEQVAKREQREELGAVLGGVPLAGLHLAELALDHPKQMLDLGPNHGDDAVGGGLT